MRRELAATPEQYPAAAALSPGLKASAPPDPDAKPIRFESIAGPPIDAIEIPADGNLIFGRSSTADRQLPDKTVSRRHCRVARRGGKWLLTDLNSRHGTYLNGIRLEPEQPAPLMDGDLVRVGPWTFRNRDAADRSSSMPTTNDLATTSHRVQRVPVRELRSVAQQRLDLLIECAAGINAAKSLTELADQVLDAVVRGTGFQRAAFIRQVSATGDVQVIAFRGIGGDAVGPDDPTAKDGEAPARSTPPDFTFSRSLINAASDGEIVRMSGDSGIGYGESIVRLGIHSALCAPIMLGPSVEAYLYLDARDSEGAIQQDAAAFCQAVSRMAGLSLANLKRLDLEDHRRLLDAELKAAREAQRRIMPGPTGAFGRVAYAMQTRPGRVVAGDLFDIAPAEDGSGRVAVFLGDVVGKGVGAAILMATAQTHLRMMLRVSADPAAVLNDTNRYVAAHSGDGEFLSLWLGVVDPASATLSFVDAGHGHWLLRTPGAEPHQPDCEGGLLLGIKPDFEYHTETVPFPPGSRVVLFSDGLVEQPDPEGEQFGMERIARALAAAGRTSSADVQADVRALAAAVFEHAESEALADDLTLASVELRDA